MWNHHYPCDFGEDLSRLHIMSFWTRHFFHFRDGDLKWISSLSMTTAAAFIDRFCLLWHGDYDGIMSPESKAFLGEGKHKKQTEEWGREVEPKKTLWVVLKKWYLQQDIETNSSPRAWKEMVVWPESKAICLLSVLSCKRANYYQQDCTCSHILPLVSREKNFKCLLKRDSRSGFEFLLLTDEQFPRLCQKPFLKIILKIGAN